MNLPDNLSTAAQRVFNLLSADASPKNKEQVATAFSQQPATEERHKAVSTVESLIVKGIVKREGDATEPTYVLGAAAPEEKPDEVYAGNGAVEGEEKPKLDTNAEEQRIINLLEKNDRKLPEAKLFDLYEQEQLPANTSEADSDAVDAALRELTDAGVVMVEGDMYQIKK